MINLESEGYMYMTQSAEAAWSVYNVAERSGRIALAPHCDTRDMAERLLVDIELIEKGPVLGQGSEGGVYAARDNHDVALKLFKGDDVMPMDFSGKLADLSANVAMHHGLKSIWQKNLVWRLRAPELHGAFIPNEITEGGVPHPGRATIFAMERIKTAAAFPEVCNRPFFPSWEARRALYVKAARRYGTVEIVADDAGVATDNNNIIIENLPILGKRGVLVAYDFYAFDGARHG